MKCDSCGNQEICACHGTVRHLLEKYGQIWDGITIEIKVTDCTFYHERKEPREPEIPPSQTIFKILEKQPNKEMEENKLLLSLLNTYPAERIAKAKLQKAIEQGDVYRPRPGYIRKT